MTDASPLPKPTSRDPADGCLPSLAIYSGVMIVYLAVWLACWTVVDQLADWIGYTTPIDFAMDVGGFGMLIFALWFKDSRWQRSFFRRFRVRPIAIATLAAYVATRFAIHLYGWLGLLTPLPTCQDFSAPRFLLWGYTDQENVAAVSQKYFVRRDSVLVVPDPLRPGATRLAWTTFRASYLRGVGPNGTSVYTWWNWTAVPARHELIARCVGQPAGFALADDATTPGRRRLTLYFDDGLPVISGTFSGSEHSLEDVAFDRVLSARDEIRNDPSIVAQLMGCDGSCGEPVNWISTEDVTARLRAMP